MLLKTNMFDWRERLYSLMIMYGTVWSVSLPIVSQKYLHVGLLICYLSTYIDLHWRLGWWKNIWWKVEGFGQSCSRWVFGLWLIRNRSPISSGAWVARFEEIVPAWYGCIDGDRFDQTIPAWFIRMVIDRFGDLDEETRKVADEELKSLDELMLTWQGRNWKWLGGLLSGWRLTSLLGYLVSHCDARYIIIESFLIIK